MFRVFVNVEYDFSLGALSHCFLCPCAPVPSIEMIVTQFWPPGYGLGQNKFAKTVKHKQQWIVQEEHDCGALIPDLTVPVANPWYAVMYPFSKRQIVFTSSVAKAEKVQIALAQTFGLPPLPMMTCGEPVSAPTAFVMNNFLNTVKIGMLPTDLFAGLINIGVSMALDFILRNKKPPTMRTDLATNFAGMLGADFMKNKVFKGFFNNILKSQVLNPKFLGKEIGKKLFTDHLTKGELIKKGVNALSLFATDALLKKKDNPTFKAKFGSDLAFVQPKVEFGGAGPTVDAGALGQGDAP